MKILNYFRGKPNPSSENPNNSQHKSRSQQPVPDGFSKSSGSKKIKTPPVSPRLSVRKSGQKNSSKGSQSEHSVVQIETSISTSFIRGKQNSQSDLFDLKEEDFKSKEDGKENSQTINVLLHEQPKDTNIRLPVGTVRRTGTANHSFSIELEAKPGENQIIKRDGKEPTIHQNAIDVLWRTIKKSKGQLNIEGENYSVNQNDAKKAETGDRDTCLTLVENFSQELINKNIIKNKVDGDKILFAISSQVFTALNSALAKLGLKANQTASGDQSGSTVAIQITKDNIIITTNPPEDSKLQCWRVTTTISLKELLETELSTSAPLRFTAHYTAENDSAKKYAESFDPEKAAQKPEEMSDEERHKARLLELEINLFRMLPTANSVGKFSASLREFKKIKENLESYATKFSVAVGFCKNSTVKTNLIDLSTSTFQSVENAYHSTRGMELNRKKLLRDAVASLRKAETNARALIEEANKKQADQDSKNSDYPQNAKKAAFLGCRALFEAANMVAQAAAKNQALPVRNEVEAILKWARIQAKLLEVTFSDDGHEHFKSKTQKNAKDEIQVLDDRTIENGLKKFKKLSLKASAKEINQESGKFIQKLLEQSSNDLFAIEDIRAAIDVAQIAVEAAEIALAETKRLKPSKKHRIRRLQIQLDKANARLANVYILASAQMQKRISMEERESFKATLRGLKGVYREAVRPALRCLGNDDYEQAKIIAKQNIASIDDSKMRATKNSDNVGYNKVINPETLLKINTACADIDVNARHVQAFLKEAAQVPQNSTNHLIARPIKQLNGMNKATIAAVNLARNICNDEKNDNELRNLVTASAVASSEKTVKIAREVFDLVEKRGNREERKAAATQLLRAISACAAAHMLRALVLDRMGIYSIHYLKDSRLALSNAKAVWKNTLTLKGIPIINGKFIADSIQKDLRLIDFMVMRSQGDSEAYSLVVAAFDETLSLISEENDVGIFNFSKIRAAEKIFHRAIDPVQEKLLKELNSKVQLLKDKEDEASVLEFYHESTRLAGLLGLKDFNEIVEGQSSEVNNFLNIVDIVELQREKLSGLSGSAKEVRNYCYSQNDIIKKIEIAYDKFLNSNDVDFENNFLVLCAQASTVQAFERPPLVFSNVKISEQRPVQAFNVYTDSIQLPEEILDANTPQGKRFSQFIGVLVNNTPVAKNALQFPHQIEFVWNGTSQKYRLKASRTLLGEATKKVEKAFNHFMKSSENHDAKKIDEKLETTKTRTDFRPGKIQLKIRPIDVSTPQPVELQLMGRNLSSKANAKSRAWAQQCNEQKHFNPKKEILNLYQIILDDRGGWLTPQTLYDSQDTLTVLMALVQEGTLSREKAIAIRDAMPYGKNAGEDLFDYFAVRETLNKVIPITITVGGEPELLNAKRVIPKKLDEKISGEKIEEESIEDIGQLIDEKIGNYTTQVQFPELNTNLSGKAIAQVMAWAKDVNQKDISNLRANARKEMTRLFTIVLKDKSFLHTQNYHDGNDTVQILKYLVRAGILSLSIIKAIYDGLVDTREQPRKPMEIGFNQLAGSLDKAFGLKDVVLPSPKIKSQELDSTTPKKDKKIRLDDSKDGAEQSPEEDFSAPIDETEKVDDRPLPSHQELVALLNLAKKAARLIANDRSNKVRARKEIVEAHLKLKILQEENRPDETVKEIEHYLNGMCNSDYAVRSSYAKKLSNMEMRGESEVSVIETLPSESKDYSYTTQGVKVEITGLGGVGGMDNKFTAHLNAMIESLRKQYGSFVPAKVFNIVEKNGIYSLELQDHKAQSKDASVDTSKDKKGTEPDDYLAEASGHFNKFLKAFPKEVLNAIEQASVNVSKIQTPTIIIPPPKSSSSTSPEGFVPKPTTSIVVPQASKPKERLSVWGWFSKRKSKQVEIPKPSPLLASQPMSRDVALKRLETIGIKDEKDARAMVAKLFSCLAQLEPISDNKENIEHPFRIADVSKKWKEHFYSDSSTREKLLNHETIVETDSKIALTIDAAAFIAVSLRELLLAYEPIDRDTINSLATCTTKDSKNNAAFEKTFSKFSPKVRKILLERAAIVSALHFELLRILGPLTGTQTKNTKTSEDNLNSWIAHGLSSGAIDFWGYSQSDLMDVLNIQSSEDMSKSEVYKDALIYLATRLPTADELGVFKNKSVELETVFTACLEKDPFFTQLKVFALREFSEECFSFLEDVAEYRANDDENQRAVLAKRIFGKFKLHEKDKDFYNLNIADKQLKELRIQLASCSSSSHFDKSFFDKVAGDVWRIMEGGPYLRFREKIMKKTLDSIPLSTE